MIVWVTWYRTSSGRSAAARRALTGALHYMQTHRAAAVRRAHAAEVYDRLPGARVVVRVGLSGRLVLRDRDGREEIVPTDSLSPQTRTRLLVETEHGLEPAAVWLNENGLPRVGCHVGVTPVACGDAGRAGSGLWWSVRWR
jgi:hypothetical protein